MKSLTRAGALFILLMLLFVIYRSLNLSDPAIIDMVKDTPKSNSSNGQSSSNKTDAPPAPILKSVLQNSMTGRDIGSRDPSAYFNFQDYILNYYPEYQLSENSEPVKSHELVVKPNTHRTKTTERSSVSHQGKSVYPHYSEKHSFLSDIKFKQLSELVLLQNEFLTEEHKELEAVKPNELPANGILQSGTKNAAIIIQTKTDLSNASISQIGNHNTSLIEQYSAFTAATGTARIEQMGHYNLAWQEQYQDNAMNDNHTDILQEGAFNLSWQRQQGWSSGVESSIHQLGDHNFAQTSQNGFIGTMEVKIRQQGSANKAFVTQHSF